MESLRQVGAGLLLGAISVVIVLGGLMLALAQGGMTPPATSTGIPIDVPIGEPVTAFPTLPLLEFTEVPPGPESTATASITPPPTLTNCHPPAGWFPIVVQSQDTLASLALTYRTTVDLLRQSNCLLSDELIASSVLYVPALPTSTPIPCGAPFNWASYRVASGDTLYRISLFYRVSVDELMRANCLNTSVIRAGQVLRVPNVPTSTAPASSPTMTVGPGITQTQQVTPTVTIEAPSPTSTVPAPTATETPPLPTETSTIAPSDTPVPSATPTTPEP